MQRLILLLFIAAGCSPAKPDLVGIWQDSPEMGSGWSDTYQLFSDGKFIFNYNQMLCDKRIVNFSGTWSWSDGKISLITKEKVVVEGGELVPATGSCASENEIEGGEIKTITLDVPETSTLEISAGTPDKDNLDRLKMSINGKPFWRMNEDPAGY